MSKQAVLLIAHGSPERVEDIPEFLQNISRGRPMPEAVVREVQHRYSLIGSSPLTRITRAAGGRRGSRTGHAGLCRHAQLASVYRRHAAGRWHLTTWDRRWPSAWRRTIRAPASDCTSRCCSGRSAPFPIDFVEEWHDHPLLIEAFADKLRAGWTNACAAARCSLAGAVHRAQRAQRTIAEGDPYEAQTRETAALVAAQVPEIGAWQICLSEPGHVGRRMAGSDSGGHDHEAYATAGHTGVFVQPIGFVCDHVEILFDIDILFRDFAAERGMKLYRAESLNDSPLFVQAVADLARTGLALCGQIAKQYRN